MIQKASEVKKIGQKEIEELVSWGRYLFWADISYLNLMNLESPADAENERKHSVDFLTFSALWLGSLWTVVEGWRELKFVDPVIDNLLSKEVIFLDHLRKFRNTVFHFQREYFDKRSTDFYKNIKFFHLAWELHYEFKRYLWMWPELHCKYDDITSDIRKSLEGSIGWMPSDIMHAHIQELKDIIKLGENTLGDDPLDNPAAKDFADAINNAKEVLKAAPTESLPDIVRKALGEKFNLGE